VVAIIPLMFIHTPLSRLVMMHSSALLQSATILDEEE